MPYTIDPITGIAVWSGDTVPAGTRTNLTASIANHETRLDSIEGTLNDGQITAALPVILPTYTVATLPSAVTYARGLAYCSNETGGAVVVFSDGTNWRRVTDRAVASS